MLGWRTLFFKEGVYKPDPTKSADWNRGAYLVEGLGQLVSTELRSSGQGGRSSVDLRDILDELRIIIEPSFTGEEMTVEWNIPAEVPAVHADRHGLLHVFMNLATNSLRALQNSTEKRLTVAVSSDGQRATVRFIDTGPGVARPDRLFQPFQQSADGAVRLERDVVPLLPRLQVPDVAAAVPFPNHATLIGSIT